MYGEPEVWHGLMDKLASTFASYVGACVRAGADVSTNETVGMPQQFHLCGSGPPGFSGRAFFRRFRREHGRKVSGVGGKASGI